MAKALIYSQIYDQSAFDFVTRVDEIADVEGENLDVRINCNGGDPTQGWGMISSYSEFEGEKSVQADGKAYSMGLFFLVYTPKANTSCLDVCQGMLHRAGYSEWFESSSSFTDDLKTNLKNINAHLEKATRNRIDVKKLEAIMDSKPETKGKKFKDIWSMDGRLNVFLTAKEMKEIELVGKVIPITPKKIQKINAQVMECAAFYQGSHKDMMIPEIEPNAENPVPKNANTNNNDMTTEEIQAKVDAAVTAALKSERNKVAGWLPFLAIDPQAVKKGIESGESIMENQAVMADLMIKMNDPNRELAPSAGATNTENPGGNDEPTPEVKSELEAAQASVNEMLNPKKS